MSGPVLVLALLLAVALLVFAFGAPSKDLDGTHRSFGYRLVTAALIMFLGVPAIYGLFAGFLMTVGAFTHNNGKLAMGLSVAGASLLVLVLLIWIQIKRSRGREH